MTSGRATGGRSTLFTRTLCRATGCFGQQAVDYARARGVVVNASEAIAQSPRSFQAPSSHRFRPCRRTHRRCG